jgi:RHS repeat-associated protein
VSKTWFPGGGTPAVTHYVYDIAGRNIAEYSSEPPASDGTFWLFADLLGSIRAVTGEKPPTESAPVLECYDYLPFGRMLTAQDNGRGTSASCYPGSPTGYTSVLDEKFTGQERDEIQLDYLIARYVSTAQGRFTSADLPFMDQHPGDPQSWNLYAYARNNPLRYVDPFGYQSVECADGLDGCVLTVDAITRTNSGDRSLLELWLFVLSYRVRDVAEIATEVAYTATDVAVNYVTAPRNPGCMALATGIGIVGGTDIGATIGGGIGLAGIAGGGAGVLATVPAGAVIGGTGGGLLGSYAGYGAGWTLCAQMSGSGGGGRGPNPNEPSVAQLDMFERQLADHGRRSLERSRRSIERRLQEHLRKLDGMRSSGGYTSSVEREISNFQRELEAIRRVLQGGRMDSQADIARLAKLFERVERLRTFGSHEDPESWALAHTLVDISESCEKICRSMVPALMRTQDEQAIEDSLHDIGEELRHIHYHIKLSRFYRYLQDKVQ